MSEEKKPGEGTEEAKAPEPTPEEVAQAKAEAAAKAKAAAEAKAKAAAAKAAIEAAKPIWERDPATPSWEDAAGDPVAAGVSERLGEVLESAATFAGELTLTVATAKLHEVAMDLRDVEGFDYLVDICGADQPKREPRFDVVYHLYSFSKNRRLRLKVKIDEETEVPSVVSVWPAANWPEREAWDMYGIRFSGHPDLTRILLWEGFNGFPLRKDFPIEGIETGSAIYPEYYDGEDGPIGGTGTGWKAPKPPEPPKETEEETG